MPTAPEYRIRVRNRQSQARIDTRSVSRLCSIILGELQASPCAVSIAFIGPRRMKALNEEFRKKAYATDVLSFAYPGETEEGRDLLGEVVICPGVARVHARQFGIGLEEEVCRLLVHGLLHLLGYDHENDKGEMLRLQRRLLRRRAIVAAASMVPE